MDYNKQVGLEQNVVSGDKNVNLDFVISNLISTDTFSGKNGRIVNPPKQLNL